MMNPSSAAKTLLASSLIFSGVSLADASAYLVPDISYAKPGQLIELPSSGPSGTRQLNLRCSGNGPTTVLLEAGSRGDSTTWYRVQPRLAKQARVCSYDRAGYGFSDEGPRPRDVDADVRDVDSLITAAAIKTPLMMVGHSLGTDIVRRYAELHRDRVAGLVLVDPPEHYIAQYAPDWDASERAATKKRFAFLQRCLDAATAGTLAEAEGDLRQCIAAPDPVWPEAVKASLRDYKLKPGFWRTIQSELANNDTLFSTPIIAVKDKSELPISILVAADTFAEAPSPLREAFEKSRDKTISEIAANTTRSYRVVVANSGHEMQMDQPQAVVDAVSKLLKQLAKGAAAKH